MRYQILAVLCLLAGCTTKQQSDALNSTTRDGRLAPALKNFGSLHHAITTESPEA
jgi:hypothetical protein